MALLLREEEVRRLLPLGVAIERSIVEDALFRENAPALARGSLPEM